jgi:anthranilate synthase component 1
MASLQLQPDFSSFCQQAKQANLVPVMVELAADYETPLSAFQKIHDGRAAFLLESAELSQHSGRYSILGSSPRLIFTARGGDIEIEEQGQVRRQTGVPDALEELKKLMAPFKPHLGGSGAPFYHGGAVGYLAYDMVRRFEPSIGEAAADQLGLPDMVFMITDTVLIFDHRTRRLMLVAHVHTANHDSLEAAYAWAQTQIEGLVAKLSKPLTAKPLMAFNPTLQGQAPQFQSNTTREQFLGMVERMKQYISAGDIFQGVASQRFECDYPGSPLDLFRALRHVNPSPYMFCLDLPQGFSLVGSSPEVHVKCINREIEIRPIAGTRWRGKTAEQDDALAQELLHDPKERAEHIMLVDLARNDVGRVAQYGSVEVTDLMIIERYSHVMHIVSNVRGELRPEASVYDVMRATFPAGTVSGSPKVRAMQIINELEPSKRCAYAGAVGYFGFDGNLDSCIALRTCVLKDGKAYVQAGAGVVADSDPQSEYQETINKAMGMLRAIEWARYLSLPDQN